MSANVSEQIAAEQSATAAQVPKRITNAQTVCNEKNAKGKLCNGHLKQLGTAGEAAEIHLRGDDVLSKCQTCGTLYMGPPLGHVRDPQKQSRFVEAELTALLQAAGGTMPVIKKDERGVFVLVESASGHALGAAKPAAAKTATAAQPQKAPTSAAAATQKPPAAAPKPAAQKAGAEPNRKLFRRSNYMGVADTGPVPGETFEQKVARLKAVAVAAKRRAEEGGGEVAPSGETSAASIASEVQTSEPGPVATAEPSKSAPSVAAAPAPAASTNTAHKPTGNADRTLMRRSTYEGVVDTGPVAGESFEQKVERLRAVSAAAKLRSEQG
ncbi:MAG: hypothetical protein H0V18_13060 [Pyrinomonadaceae bacterium]|nr:hypothetical protein [Pyrinomonadaceae bacterium]